MQIRKATKKDVPALIKLYSNLPQLRDFAGQQYRSNYFEAFLNKKNRIVLVAEHEQEIIGGLNAEFENTAQYAFLNNIVVKKTYRKRGVATALLKRIREESKKQKNKRLILVVYDWNKPMHQLMKELRYEKYGKTVVYSKKL